jgi:hypothetical protein
VELVHGPMDRVHGFGSWVHGIVDHSRLLILWCATRILLKRKGIDNLILALHLRADGSHQTRWRGRHIGPARQCHGGGLAEASLLSSPGHDDVGVFGAKQHGGWWGPYLGRNVVGNGSKVAHGGGSPPLSTDDDERWFRRSSGFKKQLNAFLVASSCFSQWRTAVTRVWFLRIEIRGI